MTTLNPEDGGCGIEFSQCNRGGTPWQSALDVARPAARGALPNALLNCRIAIIRELPPELMSAFEATIAQLLVGDSCCDAERLTQLLRDMANDPTHIPRSTLNAALDRITGRIERGEDPHKLLGALNEIQDRLVGEESQPVIQATGSRALHITLPMPEL